MSKTEMQSRMDEAAKLEAQAADMKLESRKLFNAAGKIDRELRKLQARALELRANVATTTLAAQETPAPPTEPTAPKLTKEQKKAAREARKAAKALAAAEQASLPTGDVQAETSDVPSITNPNMIVE